LMLAELCDEEIQEMEAEDTDAEENLFTEA
jgi:hypothetical protein